MISLFDRRRGSRGTDREKSQFAFFVVGTVVLLAVAFVLGIQVGRVIEKNAEKRRAEANRVAGPIETRQESGTDIREELGVFSEEAGSVPAVPPPSADARLSETEKSVTFRETLSGKEPAPVLLVAPPPADKKPGKASGQGVAAAGRLMVQAAAFRDRKAADAFRRKLSEDGFPSTVVPSERGGKGRYYRVLVGPFPDKSAVDRAIRKLKTEKKVNAFPVRG